MSQAGKGVKHGLNPEAQVVLANLLALDPAEAERRELLASKVPEAAVESLYPRSFEALVPNIILLRQQPDVVKVTEWDLQGVDILAAHALSRALPDEVRYRYYAADPPHNWKDQKLPHQLCAYLHRWEESTVPVAQKAERALWLAYWFGLHAGDLSTEDAMRHTEKLLLKVGSSLLPQLGARPKSEPAASD